MIEATALTCQADQTFGIEAVNLPEAADGQIVVRTLYSGVSIGTEMSLIRGRLSWGPYPICTGYMGVGVIEQVGSAVEDLAVGERVWFRHNDQMQYPDGRAISCTSGAHCSHAVFDPHTAHGAERLPEGVDLAAASMFVCAAVGLYGVDMANPLMGTTVVVHGAGLIGQAVIAACAHRGCRVIAVDVRDMPLEVARGMGADVVIHGGRQDVDAEVRAIVPDGADHVFECTGLPECVDPTIALCRRHGTYVWQGNYGAEPIQMHFLPPHGRRLRMFFPCDDGRAPCRRAVLKNMASGALKWQDCITHRIEAAEAPAMFDRINTGRETDALGVVIHWSDL